MSYDASDTAILLVDPYNDFLSEGGKAWPRVKDVAAKVGLMDHLRDIVGAARKNGYKLFFVPHHRFAPGDLADWKNATPYQELQVKLLMFEKGSWGGTFHDDFQPQEGDVVIKEHWGSSGFANTDLDMQLKQHGIRRIILIGLIANTCIEATGRFGQELGYHVTLVKDATSAFSDEAMRCAHEVNGPSFAHEIVTTADLLPQLVG